MEADAGVVWPQAREQLEPPEAGEGKETFSLRFLRKHDPSNTLISKYQPPELKEENSSVVLSHRVCCKLL